MVTKLISSASAEDNWTAIGAPAEITDAMRIEFLADTMHDLIATLTNDGRMSQGEAREWLAEVNAVALNRPELLTA